MKAPSTLEGFRALLETMDHRERFCFPMKDVWKEKYAKYDANSVEVYCTELYDVKGSPININIKAVDSCGKVVKNEDGKTLCNKSKYLSRCTDEYLNRMFNMFCEEQPKGE